MGVIFAEVGQKGLARDAVVAFGFAGAGEVAGREGSAVDLVDPVLHGGAEPFGEKPDRVGFHPGGQPELKVELGLIGGVTEGGHWIRRRKFQVPSGLRGA